MAIVVNPDIDLPVLRTGDRMTQAEFHRIYEQWPEHRKAELIEGVVYVGDTVSVTGHGYPHLLAGWWLMDYVRRHADCLAFDNGALALDDQNEPQPDLALVRATPALNPARFDDKGNLIGAPELVVEIANTSRSIDLNAKLRAYQRNGIPEYIVWLVRDREIRWQ